MKCVYEWYILLSGICWDEMIFHYSIVWIAYVNGIIYKCHWEESDQ